MNEITPTTPKNMALKHPLEYAEFVNWVSLPSELRQPQTQRELAVKFGVGEDTLSEWKLREGFWDLVKEKRNEWAKDKTPNVINALYNRAIKYGNAEEVKLWLQVIDGFTEKTESVNTAPANVIFNYNVNGTDNQHKSNAEAAPSLDEIKR